MTPEIAKLAAAERSFVEFTHSLSREDLELSRTEKWGPREVMIHLVFWHEQYAQIAANVLGGRKPDLLPGTFKEINASAVEQNASVPVEELIARWSTAQKKLQRISNRPEAKRLKLCLREGSKEWPFPVLVRLAAGHISTHEKKVRKLLGMTKRGRATAA